MWLGSGEFPGRIRVDVKRFQYISNRIPVSEFKVKHEAIPLKIRLPAREARRFFAGNWEIWELNYMKMYVF